MHDVLVSLRFDMPCVAYGSHCSGGSSPGWGVLYGIPCCGPYNCARGGMRSSASEALQHWQLCCGCDASCSFGFHPLWMLLWVLHWSGRLHVAGVMEEPRVCSRGWFPWGHLSVRNHRHSVTLWSRGNCTRRGWLPESVYMPGTTGRAGSRFWMYSQRLNRICCEVRLLLSGSSSRLADLTSTL